MYICKSRRTPLSMLQVRDVNFTTWILLDWSTFRIRRILEGLWYLWWQQLLACHCGDDPVNRATKAGAISTTQNTTTTNASWVITAVKKYTFRACIMFVRFETSRNPAFSSCHSRKFYFGCRPQAKDNNGDVAAADRRRENDFALFPTRIATFLLSLSICFTRERSLHMSWSVRRYVCKCSHPESWERNASTTRQITTFLIHLRVPKPSQLFDMKIETSLVWFFFLVIYM
jgi:hypothetical protein